MSMRHNGVSLVLAVLLCGEVCVAASTPWLDSVVSFNRPAGSSNDGGPASSALGPDDAQFVSVDIPETLIVAFTDNRAADGAGDDLWVYEYKNGDSRVDVYASKDNITYALLGRINGSDGLDLSASGLDYISYVKFVGLDNGGDSEGFDLDALKALHSVPIPAPAAWVLGGIGVGLVRWLRGRRML